MDFVLHFLREGDGFAHIGANTGSYTILASKVIEARTRAFEPHQDTFEKLRLNLRINDLSHLVAPVRTALGQSPGELRFTSDLDTMNHVANESYSGTCIIVPVEHIDSALAGFSTSLWKIDVEGFEEQALSGAMLQLRDPTLKAIILETVTPSIISLLQENGFERVAYDPWIRRFSDGGPMSHNTLWIRDRSECAARVMSAPKFQVFGLEF